MRIVRNRWSPDVCGCVLEYEFDADEPDAEKRDADDFHTVVQVQRCPDHPAPRALFAKGQPSPMQDLYSTVLEECRAVGKTFRAAVEAGVPDLTVTERDGSVAPRPGAWQWAFDSARVLHYSFPTADEEHLEEVSAKLAEAGVLAANVEPAVIDAMVVETAAKIARA